MRALQGDSSDHRRLSSSQIARGLILHTRSPLTLLGKVHNQTVCVLRITQVSPGVLKRWRVAQVWAHLVCLQVQMSQHPRHFHYNFSHYMCDLCQHELRVQAAQVGSRSGRVSPRSTSSIAHRKTTLACTRPEVRPSRVCLRQQDPLCSLFLSAGMRGPLS